MDDIVLQEVIMRKARSIWYLLTRKEFVGVVNVTA